MSEADELVARTVEFRLPEPAVAKEPGPFFEMLRSKCPVAKADSYGGFWLLSRYTDVHDAVLNTPVFSSASGITIPVVPQPPVICLEQDEPEHRKYRRPMQSWFSAGRMSRLEDSIRGIVSACLDEVVADGRADFATAVAAPVPPMVIALLLGLPESDWPWFREREGAFLRLATEGDEAGSAAAVNDLKEYLSARLEDRKRAPTDDMLSEILAVTVDGEPIRDEQAVSLAFLILGAAHETTVGGIGGMLYHVTKNAAIRDQLIADPSLIENAVEEAIRLEAPLPGLGRMLTDDAVVDGVAMPRGDRVMLLFAAANRDPDVFECPEDFRVDRTNNRHLGFGAGIHRCVGAPLARLEMRVVLEEVLRRMPNIRLEDDSAVRVECAVGRSYATLPVSW